MLETVNSFFQAILLVCFCAMIVDGRIDPHEVNLNQSLYEKSPMGQEAPYARTANHFIKVTNTDASAFMEGYFNA